MWVLDVPFHLCLVYDSAKIRYVCGDAKLISGPFCSGERAHS